MCERKKPEWEAVCHHTDTCGLTGSAAFILSMPRTHLLVNGPLWCYFYALRYLENAEGVLSGRMTCTQPAQAAVVYGTEEDLLRGFEGIKKTDHPDRVFVENNCSISMIGDDIEGIAARADLPWPVEALDSGGIHGGFAGGWALAFLRAEQQMKPLPKEEGTVNLLGLTPFLLKGRQDCEEIVRLLSLCGIRVLSMPGGGSSWEEIMEAPRAALNIVVRSELALSAAEAMERDFGIPYIEAGLPYGIEGTRQWLERITGALGQGSMRQVSEEMHRVHTAVRRKSMDMESLWGPLWFDRILVAALPSEAAGLAEAVRGEWADTGHLEIHFQVPSGLRPPAADAVYTCGEDDQAIAGTYEDWEGGLLLGSAHEAARMIRMGKSFSSCTIAYPAYDEMFLSDLPFCGIRGAAYLCERLWNAKLREKLGRRNKAGQE